MIYDKEPKNIEKILSDDSKGELSRKYIFNAAYRENGQRNFILNGIKNAEPEDIILISDVDEIPNLENFNFKDIKKNSFI